MIESIILLSVSVCLYISCISFYNTSIDNKDNIYIEEKYSPDEVNILNNNSDSDYDIV